MTDLEYRATVIETIVEMTLTHLETVPAVSAAWQEFKNLVTPLRAGDNTLGTALLDAANGYAVQLATSAFLAGVAFDGRALLLQAARDMEAARD